MQFDSAMSLMHFIYENRDSHNWFTTDVIRASAEDWKLLQAQFAYLVSNGYIRQENNHMFTVLKSPDQ